MGGDIPFGCLERVDGAVPHLTQLNLKERIMKKTFRVSLAVALIFGATTGLWAAEPMAAVSTSGFVDVYYGYNTNNPPSRINVGSNFDFRHDNFSVSLAELVFQKAADPVGFRVDLNFGETTDWVHCGALSCNNTLSAEEPYRHVQQAYLSWVGSGIGFDIGKMTTHMGAEVIESKDNWNYSRGLLFAWAIPYYHAGVKMNIPVSDQVWVNGYVYNGWNNVVENSDTKTYGVQIGLKPTDKFSALLNWIGPEDGLAGGLDRHVYEAIATLNVNGNLAFMVDYNYGRQDGPLGQAQTYNGVALYGRWSAEDCAVAVRYEHTDDADDLMYGTGVGPTVQEVTVTGEHKVANNLLVRLEYRHDSSDKMIFPEQDVAAGSETQNRVVAGLVYSF